MLDLGLEKMFQVNSSFVKTAVLSGSEFTVNSDFGKQLESRKRKENTFQKVEMF